MSTAVLQPAGRPAARLGGQQRQRQAAAAPAGRMQWRSTQRRMGILCGMHVPSESFGGQSPERKAAQSLQTFFTFVAARIVMSQLEGIGRGDLGAYNADGCRTLRRFLQEESMKDTNAWLAKLMQEDELLGVRILEVRQAYAQEDFEWDNLKRLSLEGLATENTALLRQHASERFGAMMGQAGGGGGEGAEGQP